jgi:hypothetical protein
VTLVSCGIPGKVGQGVVLSLSALPSLPRSLHPYIPSSSSASLTLATRVLLPRPLLVANDGTDEADWLSDGKRSLLRWCWLRAAIQASMRG